MTKSPDQREPPLNVTERTERLPSTQGTSQSVEWYTEGETRVVEAAGVRMKVRFVGRRGRRARIAITAPAGSTFLAEDGKSEG